MIFLTEQLKYDFTICSLNISECLIIIYEMDDGNAGLQTGRQSLKSHDMTLGV
jgi:hypothetical protein